MSLYKHTKRERERERERENEGESIRLESAAGSKIRAALMRMRRPIDRMVVIVKHMCHE
jgi:hypothetical protein